MWGCDPIYQYERDLPQLHLLLVTLPSFEPHKRKHSKLVFVLAPSLMRLPSVLTVSLCVSFALLFSTKESSLASFAKLCGSFFQFTGWVVEILETHSTDGNHHRGQHSSYYVLFCFSGHCNLICVIAPKHIGMAYTIKLFHFNWCSESIKKIVLLTMLYYNFYNVKLL